MRAVVQRVTTARVRVGDRLVGEIGRGLLAFVGIAADDAATDVRYVAGKILDMRVFDGDDGRPNHRSVIESGGSVLLVSQFTLYGDMRKGRRPSFDAAAGPDAARQLYEDLVRELATASIPIATGEFRATMAVELVNDGPVTILIDSRRQF
jgi:D-tyrosyl-tRNA(Tyr) deacylase